MIADTALTVIVETLISQMVRVDETPEPICSSIDRVPEYAKETLSLGLTLLEFKDTIREGDGNAGSISFVLNIHSI